MNKTKRILTAFIAAITILTMAGCGADNTTESSLDTGSTDIASNTENATKETDNDSVATDTETTDNSTIFDMINAEVDNYVKTEYPRRRFVSEDYFYVNAGADIYQLDRATNTLFNHRDGFWYRNHIYTMETLKRDKNGYVSGTYLNKYTPDGQLAGRILLPTGTSVGITEFYIDSKENIVICDSKEVSAVIVADANLTNVQVLPLPEKDKYDVSGIYHDKICYFDKDAIYLMDIATGTSEKYSELNNDLIESKSTIVIGKYLFLDKAIIDMDKNEIVYEADNDTLTKYNKSADDFDGIDSYARYTYNSGCTEYFYDYVREYAGDEHTITKYSRNADYIIGIDKTDGELIYTKAEACVSVNDEWIFIQDENFDEVFINTVTNEKIVIESAPALYFEKHYENLDFNE